MIPSEQKLLKLLSNNDATFYIPPYQRNYEWDTEQCSVFLADLEKTADLNRSGTVTEHFFGTITYFQTDTPFGQPDKLVLIDGQQRITTTMLFLVALRDVLDDAAMKRFIDSKYLKNENAGDDTEYKIKLKQVESDWQAYRDIILSAELTDQEKNSAVYRNYNWFRNELNRIKSESPEKLEALINGGLSCFSIITIELKPEKNSWENPQEIFESMNSLGKPLSLADLVRNYLLLGLTPDQQSELYNQYWLPMETRIPKQVSNFIRDYMQGVQAASYPKATETNYKVLYRTFKKLFAGADAEELMQKMSALSKLYACIVLGSETGNARIDRRLRDIRTLGATTTYSFLLMLLQEWKNENLTDKDTAAILEALMIFLLRRRILAMTAPENKVVPTLVQNIPELLAAADKKTAMFEILSSRESNFRLPNDIEVTRGLETMNFYNFKLAKFVLCLIEEKITKTMPDMQNENLQIEHIMPQTLNEQWQEDLGPDYAAIHLELVHNIGNLTLICHNQELGQKPFAEKKKIYAEKAGLQLARKEIINRSVWDRDSILNRRAWITQYLLEEVIPIPESMRRSSNFAPKESNALSFVELDLIGQEIVFSANHDWMARVVSDREVEFEGKKTRLSPLTRTLFERMEKCNASGSYRGADYWEYNGVKLVDLL